MSVFAAPFLFLRDPHGGVEDLDRMKAAGFRAVFCNIGDHDPSEWEAIVRPRAASQGMPCGPWLRTATADNRFDYGRLDFLIACADNWRSPLIVNAESELNGTGDTITTHIRKAIGTREAAVSMEPIPFANVAWYPLADVPMLPQLDSKQGYADPIALREMWQAWGIRCVYPTLATWGGSKPSDYPLQAPYSLYTADDCGGDYARWSPTSTGYVGCVQSPPDPNPPDPEGNGDMTKIGSQDGVTAACNRLRDLDPGGTLLVKAGGKWPSLDTLAGTGLDKWKAWDKLERTLTILVDDHDADVPGQPI